MVSHAFSKTFLYFHSPSDLCIECIWLVKIVTNRCNRMFDTCNPCEQLRWLINCWRSCIIRLSICLCFYSSCFFSMYFASSRGRAFRALFRSITSTWVEPEKEKRREKKRTNDFLNCSNVLLSPLIYFISLQDVLLCVHSVSIYDALDSIDVSWGRCCNNFVFLLWVTCFTLRVFKRDREREENW